MKIVSRMFGLTGLVVLAAACSEGATAPYGDTALASVQPAGGTTGVSVGATVVVTFDHAVMAGMEAYAVLHEGTVTGPAVQGVWSRSADGTQLVFTPAAPLKAATTYVIHLGGGMMDAQGNRVNLEMHGLTHMGGAWATQTMMGGGGMMGGGMMGGMLGASHMGTGWQHANGSYGMVFTFTTAA